MATKPRKLEKTMKKPKASNSLRLIPAIAIFSAFLILGSSAISQAAPVAPKNYIVVFKDTTNVTSEFNFWKNKRLSLFNSFRSAFKGMTVKVDSNQLKQLRQDPDILYVEQDSVVSIDATQSGATWGLDRIDQADLPLDNTYNYQSDGSGVNVFVVDTGILLNHSEFSGRLLPGYSAVAGGTNDCEGHGTHVAATIGGSTYGVAKGVNLTPVRVLDCRGSGSTSGVLAGLDWIARNVTTNSTKAVVNMSLGGGFSRSLNDAVQNLVIDKGIPVVVAAGNSSTDACRTSPAAAPNAITVGATDRNDNFASYSNRGSCVDILAPGSGVTSAYYSSPTATATMSGTSMASPHVAGAVALLYGDSWKSPATLQSALLANAISGTINSVPSRTVNKFLSTGYTEPVASVSPASQTRTGSKDVAITPTATLNVMNLPGDVTYSIAPSGITATSVADAGLVFDTSTGVLSGTPNRAFSGSYVITASNGTLTATATLTIEIAGPVAPAISPASRVITGTRGTTLDISGYTATGSFSGSVSYSIEPALPDGLSINSSTGAITGSPNQSIAQTRFVVTATDGTPDGTATATLDLTINEPVVNSAPGAPTALSATASSRRATLSWTAGATNGGSVNSHTIRVFEVRSGVGVLVSTVTWRSGGTSVTVTGLSPRRQYFFTVAATNRYGTSAQSLASQTVTVR